MEKLDYQDLRNYLDTLFDKLEKEAKLFNNTGDLNLFKNKYKFVDSDSKQVVVNDNAQILILGLTSNGIKSKDIEGIFKKHKLSDSYECINYDSLTNFDFSTLEYSSKYSDIFVGPIPHKVRGIKSDNPLNVLIDNSEKIYPKIHVLKSTSHTLKITKENLKEAIVNSTKLSLLYN